MGDLRHEPGVIGQDLDRWAPPRNNGIIRDAKKNAFWAPVFEHRCKRTVIHTWKPPGKPRQRVLISMGVLIGQSVAHYARANRIGRHRQPAVLHLVQSCGDAFLRVHQVGERGSL